MSKFGAIFFFFDLHLRLHDYASCLALVVVEAAFVAANSRW